MPFQLDTAVPVLAVFLQGLFSFFSPCVLPLVPLYVGYLAGGTGTKGADGVIHYQRRTILINTFGFILGISAAFFLLGFGVTALGQFFNDRRLWFARLSGIIMILFGLYQLGLFGKSGALEREHRLPFRLSGQGMTPLVALALGFTFSFAWTPCVGPALGSVLLMASTSNSAGAAALLIGVYTLGFVLPFLAVGLFTGTVLNFFKRHQKVVQYTVKAGAALLILMGLMTLTGYMNGFTSYLAGPVPAPQPDASSSSQQARPVIPAPDFTLLDQNGETHTLSDYRGKTVFLNFWATWCTYCKLEMGDIQKLYESYGSNQEDLVVLGIAAPNLGQEGSQEDIEAFLSDQGFTFPVVMDLDGSVFYQYGIRAFPTTFMIDADGNVYGALETALSGSQMESVVQQTMDAQN